MRRSFSKHYLEDCAKNESINACRQLRTVLPLEAVNLANKETDLNVSVRE